MKLFKTDQEVIWHNGGTGGYRSFIGFVKATKTAVVVFEQLGRFRRSDRVRRAPPPEREGGSAWAPSWPASTSGRHDSPERWPCMTTANKISAPESRSSRRISSGLGDEPLATRPLSDWHAIEVRPARSFGIHTATDDGRRGCRGSLDLALQNHPPGSLEATTGRHLYPAVKSITKTWDAGPAPKIVVELYGGNISAVQSADGRVLADITTSANFKNSQAGADAAANGVVLTTDHEGDTIRIRATNPRTSARVLAERPIVALRVPPGARLGLLTGHGYIQALASPAESCIRRPTASQR